MGKRTPKGFVLIMSVLVLATLLMIGSYLISVANAENKIAANQFLASKNYYLAETGISEMLWKIKNNTTTRENFIYGTLSQADDISRPSVFGDSRASYQISARNTVPAEAWITATSTYQINSHISQRVVKSYISLATNAEPNWQYGIFSGGRGGQQNGNFVFTGSGTVLVENNGRLHANQVFKVKGCEVVVNNGAVTSSNVINVVAGGTLTLNNSYQEAPTSTIDMLKIDYDSDSPHSWKNRATQSFTEAEFNDLPDNSTLSGIIFINGDARIINKNIAIDGVLVATGNADISTDNNNITITKNDSYGGGILAKNNVNINVSRGQVLINGLIYSANNLEIISDDTNFEINGAIAGFDARVTASGGPIILNYVPENITLVTNPTYNPNAPLIVINHWEEQY